MKKILYLALAVAAMMAVGCNKENLDSQKTAPTVDEVFSPEGTGFLKLDISLPQTLSTKANDVFDDGSTNEYTVENAILVLFSGPAGAAEDDLVLRSAYNLGKGTWNDGHSSTGQITIERSIVTEIERTGIDPTDEIWAMVILNHHSYYEVDNSALNSSTSLFFGTDAATRTDLTGSTFKEIREKTITIVSRRFDTHSIFMTNMPYADKGGYDSAPTGVVIKNLYKVDTSLIYLDRIEAQSGKPAVTVNVERALAKVDVNWDTATEFKTLEGYKANILGWFIDNTNPTSYTMRNVMEPLDAPLAYLQYKSTLEDGYTHPYRMLAKDPVCQDLDHPHVYRSYWGIDPNYDTKATDLVNKGGQYVRNWEMKWNGDVQTADSGDLRTNHSAYYCAENTFDVAHQSVSQTTRVVIAAEFNEGKDFYTINVEEGKMYDSVDKLKTYVLGQVLQRVSVVNWLQDNFQPSAYTGGAGSDGTQLIQVNVGTPALEAGEVVVTVTPASSIASYLKADKTEELARSEWADNQANMDEYLASNYKINFHKGGIAYYQALIRHFDDKETPWVAAVDMANTTEGVYAGNANNFLGRFGVVRNNWYSIEVTGIRQIGEPLVPSVDPGRDPDLPDDQVKEYLQVRINVMPWAKRVQGVVL